jgi:hypothetical protein
LRLHFVLIASFVCLAASAGSASASTGCTGDTCVVTGGFARLQADIATSGAPASVTHLLTGEVSLSQALHPPNPCVTACVPSFAYLSSEYLLVLVDYQVGALSGLLPRTSCPGGCSFPPSAARVIDGDIRTMFADPTISPPGPPTLPTFTPSTN